VAEFIAAVEEAGGATISKYSAFADRSVDGRLCGAFLFSGGGQTGRYSSLGVQLQNLRRDVFDNPQEMIDLVMRGDELPEPSRSLSRLIRACIYHPKGLSWVDYSNIEGRVAPWLANNAEGEAKLDVFRQGLDPYKINAARVFNVAYDAVTKHQRQAGKIQELALGFLGGVGALKSMGKGFGLVIEDDYGKVLRDGASAQYGSDAIAGVINVRLREQSEGGDLTLNYGVRESSYETPRGTLPAGATWSAPPRIGRNVSDGDTITVSGWKGFALGEAGFVTVAAEYKDQDRTERGGYDFRQQYPLVNGTFDQREQTIDRFANPSSIIACHLRLSS
jgi:hypothetical protein